MGHGEFENLEVLNAREMSQHLCHRHDCLDWALEDGTDQTTFRGSKVELCANWLHEESRCGIIPHQTPWDRRRRVLHDRTG
jgi:hypothetical protein